MNPYLLEQFLAFYRTGTLSAAAESLYISQPALSQSMYRLEEIVGVPLFVRQKNKTTINENGLLLAQYAEKILALQEEMLEAVREQALHLDGLQMGSIAPGPLIWLEPLVRQHFPDLEVGSLLLDDDTEILQGLKEGHFDLAISRQATEEAGLFCQELMTETLSMRLPQSHPLAQKEALTWADLAGQNILLLSDLGFWTDFVKRVIPTANFVYIENSQAFNDIASMGNFPTFVTEISQPANPADKTVTLPIKEEDAATRFYLLLRESDRYKWERLLQVIETNKLS